MDAFLLGFKDKCALCGKPALDYNAPRFACGKTARVV
jgi:hypothetical protein